MEIDLINLQLRVNKKYNLILINCLETSFGISHFPHKGLSMCPLLLPMGMFWCET